MNYRRRQIAGKIESSPGTAESLSATDAKSFAFGAIISMAGVENYDRNPERNTGAKLGTIPGKRPLTLPFELDVKGSGTATTEADFVKYMRACGHEVNAFYAITIGEVTSGPFQHGETITGANSGATGKVLIDTADGTTTLYFIQLTGTFENAETITGGTSGATATTGSTPSETGKAVTPISTSIPTITLAGYEDGVRKLLKGCVGNQKIRWENGKPVRLSHNFMGVEQSIDDAAYITGITRESTVPPAFMAATVTLNSTALRFRTLEFDAQNEIAPVDDPSETYGIKMFMWVDRVPVITADFDMLLVAAFDFHGYWRAATKMPLNLQWGSDAGNQFRFYAPQVQINDVEDGDREGVKVANVKMAVCGRGSLTDDDYVMLCY